MDKFHHKVHKHKQIKQKHKRKDNDPIIVAYCICFNEEELIDYYLQYYLSFVKKVIIYDNMSTDSTRKIIKSYKNTEIRDFDTKNQLNDLDFLKIKNDCYKEQRGKADYCIVSDVDEFLYYPKLLQKLKIYKQNKITLPKVTGYNMVGFKKLSPGPLIEQVTNGVQDINHSKRIIFNPEININYGIGCHSCHPSGRIIESDDCLMLLHYKYISLEHVLKRNDLCAQRLSSINKANGWSFHFAQNKKITTEHFENLKSHSNKIIHSFLI